MSSKLRPSHRKNLSRLWKSYIIFIIKFPSAWKFAFLSLLWRAIILVENPNLNPSQFPKEQIKKIEVFNLNLNNSHISIQAPPSLFL